MQKNVRSNSCIDEGLVQKRHDASGGLGPVVHTAADQLDHMVYGTATSMPGQGDIDCVKALLMDITGFNPAHDPYPQPHPKPIRKTNIIGSQTPATTNLGGACIYIDRGCAFTKIKRLYYGI